MQAFYDMVNSYRFPVTGKYRLQVVSVCAIRKERGKSPGNRYLVTGNCSTLPINKTYPLNLPYSNHNEGSGMFIKRVTIVIFGFFYNYTTRTWEYLMRTLPPVLY
jgi:hypothetical protein